MPGSRSISVLTGALFAALTLPGCSSSQTQYKSEALAPRAALSYASRHVQNHDSRLERTVENELGSPILHDYKGRYVSFAQEAEIERVQEALTHLDTLGVNIEGRTDDAQLVLSTGWDNSIVGKYYAGQSEDSVVEDYYQDSSDKLFPPDPKGIMAVEIPSRRFDKPHDGSVYAGTILHEAVHNQVAQLPNHTREDLYECFKEVGAAEYRGDTWDDSGAMKTWLQGWMSRYASKNIHEDVASTTTLVLNERSDEDRRISGPGRIPFTTIRGYMDESQRRKGWNRIERKITCLHDHGLLFDEEYEHVNKAFSGDSVTPGRLGYDMRHDSLIDTVNSMRPYEGRK